MLRRTSRISWAPSGWFVEFPMRSLATSLHIFACPDDFYSVRLGFANVGPAAYTVTKAIAAPSTTPGDFINPTGGAAWVPLTFANHGVDIESLVINGGAPTEIVVSAAKPAWQRERNIIPSWTWTDWTPIASRLRTDIADAPRLLMVRTLLPSDQKITQPNGNFNGFFAQSAVNHGFEYGAGWVPVDLVTEPDRPLNNVSAANFGEARATVACIQFATKNRGLVGMAAGDSHHQGTSTTTQFLNYLLRATVLLGSGWVGKVPFGYVATAVGGATSEQFFLMLHSLLPAIRPSFVVLPGWTYNDQGEVHADEAANNIFMARLVLAADNCILNGAVPIFLTPFPRDAGSMTAAQVEPWRKLRHSILSMRYSGAAVVDATAILGAKTDSGEFDGTYRPGFSSDGAHPNDAGHAAVSYALMVELNRITGLTGPPHCSLNTSPVI